LSLKFDKNKKTFCDCKTRYLSNNPINEHAVTLSLPRVQLITVTWWFDSNCVISYRCSVVTDSWS